MSMRLGKVQAAGYVEETEASVQTEVLNLDTEREFVTADPEQAVVAG
jgi:hypothetical protein